MSENTLLIKVLWLGWVGGGGQWGRESVCINWMSLFRGLNLEEV